MNTFFSVGEPAAPDQRPVNVADQPGNAVDATNQPGHHDPGGHCEQPIPYGDLVLVRCFRPGDGATERGIPSVGAGCSIIDSAPPGLVQ
jgi:hypothetical protein